MRILTNILASVVLAGGAAAANTVCTNNQCITCDGPIACVNGSCTCNGVPVVATDAPAQQGPCAGQETVAHSNGGGRVAVTAAVEPSVYVSSDSTICGSAVVSGPTRLIERSQVNGRANISGKSILNSSTVNGTATVLDSSLRGATVNGNARVSRSEIVDSTLNGRPIVDSSTVTNSTVNGNASIVGRRIEGTVLNN
jgi:hypothetical protein